MKKILTALLAILLISAGANAANKAKAANLTASTSSKLETAAFVKKMNQSANALLFTYYVVYSHYDSGSNQTWIFVCNTFNTEVSTAYYMSGGSPVNASYLDTNATVPGSNSWYWVDANTIHVTCTVHYNQSDLGKFQVDEDMILNFD